MLIYAAGRAFKLGFFYCDHTPNLRVNSVYNVPVEYPMENDES